MKELKLFRLLSGEEILANVIADTITTFTLDNVVGIHLQGSEGKFHIGLAPFMPYTEGNIELAKTAVAAIGQPNPDLAREHGRIFGEIVIAPANSIIR